MPRGPRKSRIEKVRLDTLRLPPAGKAQRPFHRAKGDRIATEFDINCFGVPVVCRADDVNWLVDGQHRVYGIQKSGYAKSTDEIDCELYEGLPIDQMARLFLGRNQTSPVTAFERFGVAVTAGYPAEVEINAIAERVGLRIGHPKTRGNVFAGRAAPAARSPWRAGSRACPAPLARCLPVDSAWLRAFAPRRARPRARHLLANRRRRARARSCRRAARRARSAASCRGLSPAPRPPAGRLHRRRDRRHLQRCGFQAPPSRPLVEGAASRSVASPGAALVRRLAAHLQEEVRSKSQAKRGTRVRFLDLGRGLSMPVVAPPVGSLLRVFSPIS